MLCASPVVRRACQRLGAAASFDLLLKDELKHIARKEENSSDRNGSEPAQDIHPWKGFSWNKRGQQVSKHAPDQNGQDGAKDDELAADEFVERVLLHGWIVILSVRLNIL